MAKKKVSHHSWCELLAEIKQDLEVNSNENGKMVLSMRATMVTLMMIVTMMTMNGTDRGFLLTGFKIWAVEDGPQ